MLDISGNVDKLLQRSKSVVGTGTCMTVEVSCNR